MTEKPKLSSHLKDSVLQSYSSVAQAAAAFEIPYERFKKAIRENAFTASDLSKVMPGLTLGELEARFDFSVKRRYATVSGPEIEPPMLEAHAFNSIYTPFALIKRAVAETELQNFVNDLYVNLSGECSMFLFLGEASTPVEWKGDRETVGKVSSAISNGAVVVYITEEPRESEFAFFLDTLKWSAKARATPTGFVALLKVDRCKFCAPHQRSALLNFADDANLERALTAIEVPANIDGGGEAGILVLPLVVDVAERMKEYLRRILFAYYDADKFPESFGLQTYPAMDERDFMGRLAALIWRDGGE